MKVVLIYRRNVPGAFSIETLFHSVATELSSLIEIIEYEVGPRKNTLRDAFALRAMKADVYHITGDVSFLALLLPRHKTVVTVHDIGHYRFGLSGLKRWIYKWVWLKLPLRWAAKVTSVSEESRSQAVQHLDIPARKIRVIQNCYRPDLLPVAGAFDGDAPAILQIGTKQHKNVPRLIEALTGLGVRLVLVGRLDGPTMVSLEQRGIAYENHIGISDEALRQLYADCDIVSFVSTSEGFGMPIIEAQAVGRPVVTGNIPPMSDVAGDGACLVDPLDVAAIRAGIERIIGDEAYRERLVEAGRANVARFSVTRIGAEYLALYREVART